MENIQEIIQNDLRTALKGRRELEVSTLRLLGAAIINKEKEKRIRIARSEKDLKEEELVEKSRLTDEEIIEVVLSEIKKRKEAILGFSAGSVSAPAREKAKIQNLIDKEKKEIKILKKYLPELSSALPEQLSEKEVRELAKDVVGKTKAQSMKDMGKVMRELMPKIKGKADGSLVSKIVKELLTPK